MRAGHRPPQHGRRVHPESAAADGRGRGPAGAVAHAAAHGATAARAPLRLAALPHGPTAVLRQPRGPQRLQLLRLQQEEGVLRAAQAEGVHPGQQEGRRLLGPPAAQQRGRQALPREAPLQRHGPRAARRGALQGESRAEGAARRHQGEVRHLRRGPHQHRPSPRDSAYV